MFINMHQDFLSNFDDVAAFHQKFQLPPQDTCPTLLEQGLQEFRIKFMQEELNEFCEAVEGGDLPQAADALIDLVYVAMGTAYLMGLPWQKLWDEVQRANMSKVRTQRAEDSARGNAQWDVVKPKGWIPPNIELILEQDAQEAP